MDSATLWGTWGLWGLLGLVSLATFVWRATGAAIAARIGAIKGGEEPENRHHRRRPGLL